MLIVDVRENDSLDRALKKFKKRMEKAKIIQELRDRQYFEKPSVKKRATFLRAAYRQQIRSKLNL